MCFQFLARNGRSWWPTKLIGQFIVRWSWTQISFPNAVNEGPSQSITNAAAHGLALPTAHPWSVYAWPRITSCVAGRLPVGY